MRLKEITISANTGLDAIKRAPIVDEYTGLKCLRIQDISQKKEYDDWGNTQTTENDYKKFKLRIDDILVARTGATVGVSYLVRKNLNAVFNNGSIRLRLSDKADAHFVYYVFQTKSFNQYIDNVSCVATQPNLRVETLLKFNIPDYNINIQRRIASILSAYDNLIENTNRRIRLLEQIVENLYKEWFVRFRFPGHEKMEFENGLPKDWQVLSICKSPYFRFAQCPVKNFTSVKHYFATADVDATYLNSEGELIDFENKPSRAQISPSRNSIWFARMINSYKILSFNKCNEELRVQSILSSGFVGFETTPEYYGFMYALISSKDFDKVKDMYSTGSTQISLTNGSLEKIKHISPTSDIAKKFSVLVMPIIEEMTILRLNNKPLEKRRDLLLPRLMSGKLEVNA